MKKAWIIGYLVIVIAILSVFASKMIAVDPYFHFHAPNTDAYFYYLNNQRSQNDGIMRNFDYEGIITGSSMTENFKTSEADEIFGAKFVKVPFSGGTYNEINNRLTAAANRNQNLKYVIRGLDMYYFFDDKDALRSDLGRYPTYLYDDNWFNDVEYVFNRDVFFQRVYPMLKENQKPDFQGGITPFDAYSNWMIYNFPFGHKTLFPDGFKAVESATPVKLDQNDIDAVTANVQQNVTALAQKYPDVTFYYFIPPYSAAWWYSLLVNGKLNRQIDAERIVIEEILKCGNIKLFSFNCIFDMITDLNNYKDETHYGEWINSLMLRYMYDGNYQLTRANYMSYLEKERQFYMNYDYSQLVNQADYENDYYAAALKNRDILGTEPYHIDLENSSMIELSGASIENNQYDGQTGIVCTGSLERPSMSEIAVSDYLRDTGYIGARIRLTDLTPYKYLVLYG